MSKHDELPGWMTGNASPEDRKTAPGDALADQPEISGELYQLANEALAFTQDHGASWPVWTLTIGGWHYDDGTPHIDVNLMVDGRVSIHHVVHDSGIDPFMGSLIEAMEFFIGGEVNPESNPSRETSTGCKCGGNCKCGKDD